MPNWIEDINFDNVIDVDQILSDSEAIVNEIKQEEQLEETIQETTVVKIDTLWEQQIIKKILERFTLSKLYNDTLTVNDLYDIIYNKIQKEKRKFAWIILVDYTKNKSNYIWKKVSEILDLLDPEIQVKVNSVELTDENKNMTDYYKEITTN